MCDLHSAYLFAQQVQKARPDLRVIISSATLEAGALASYFDARTDRRKQAAAVPIGDVSRVPAVLSVEGRTHDVKVCTLLSGFRVQLPNQRALLSILGSMHLAT